MIISFPIFFIDSQGISIKELLEKTLNIPLFSGIKSECILPVFLLMSKSDSDIRPKLHPLYKLTISLPPIALKHKFPLPTII